MNSGNWDSGDLAGALGAYEAAPAVMLAFEGDEMVVASANEAARAAFGDRCEQGVLVRDMAPEVDNRTLDLMDDMVGRVFATGRSMTTPAHRVRVREEDQESFEVFWDLSVSPWFAEDGSVLGVLAHGVDVTERTRIRHASVDAMHDIVTMQDALLPDWLPVLPGVEIAGRYLSAHAELAAGGDWYDAVGLPDGRVALMVGDVATHGVVASAVMGRLRSVAMERFSSGAGLEGTMAALDFFARGVPEASAATICVVVLDPVTGVLEYCTAGHPPPLVVRPRAHGARFLPHTGAAPLATTGQMTVVRDHVERGDLVVLYTDGILSRPGRSPAVSTVELGQVATDAAVGSGTDALPGPADRVCDRALDVMTRTTGYADDIAILVAEVTETTPPLHLDLPADDKALQVVLDAMADWLGSMRVRDLDLIVVQHAVDELVTNVVEHAYASTSGGRLTVQAGLLGTGELEVRFADRGRWAPSRAGPGHGRGLSIVRGMVDRLVLDAADHGTVATIRHRLSRPAHMLTGAPTAAGLADPEEALTLTTYTGCVALTGPLDHAGLDDLAGALARVSDDGQVVLDMERVTRLPSSAVQALHVACRDAADRGQDLILYAPAGTTAQHVLELVRLPYVLSVPGRVN